MGLVECLILEVIPHRVSGVHPRTAPHRLRPETVVSHRFDVVFGHYLAALEHCPSQQTPEVGLGSIGMHSDGERIDNLDGLLRRLPQLPRQPVAVAYKAFLVEHGAFQAELYVLCGQSFTVVEHQALWEPEGPTVPIWVYSPFLGNTRTYSAILGL